MGERDGGPAKTVLVVVLVLLGLGILCCGGIWLGRDALVEYAQVELGDAVVGSGILATEERSVEAFDRVSVSGSATVEIAVGDEQSVAVEGDDNVVPIVLTVVRDGVLEVSTDGSYMTDVGVTVRITVPELVGVTLSGSGDVVATGVDALDFAIDITGSGEVRVTGRTDIVSVGITGSGDADLFGLIAREAHASILGSGDIQVHATETLDAAVSGSGDITYDGDPSVSEPRITGSGTVAPRSE